MTKMAIHIRGTLILKDGKKLRVTEKDFKNLKVLLT